MDMRTANRAIRRERHAKPTLQELKSLLIDISAAASQYDCSHYVRHYFGSHHGKGPADGESAVIKEACRRGIKSDCDDMHDFLESSNFNLQPTQDNHRHYRRSFFKIDDIKRD